MNSDQRFAFAVTALQSTVLQYVLSSHKTISSIETWTRRCCDSMLQAYEVNRDLYSAHPDASPFLGIAGKRMYAFVRNTLAIPFLRTHHIRSPDPGSALPDPEDESIFLESGTAKDDVTTGTFLTIIYSAIRNGSLYVPVMECLREAQQNDVTRNCEPLKASKPEKVVDSLISESKVSV